VVLKTFKGVIRIKVHTQCSNYNKDKAASKHSQKYLLNLSLGDIFEF